MEPVADALDEIIIRLIAWCYAILGWTAYIVLGLALAVLVFRLLWGVFQRLHSAHSPFGKRATHGVPHDFTD